MINISEKKNQNYFGTDKKECVITNLPHNHHHIVKKIKKEKRKVNCTGQHFSLYLKASLVRINSTIVCVYNLHKTHIYLTNLLGLLT